MYSPINLEQSTGIRMPPLRIAQFACFRSALFNQFTVYSQNLPLSWVVQLRAKYSDCILCAHDVSHVSLASKCLGAVGSSDTSVTSLCLRCRASQQALSAYRHHITLRGAARRNQVRCGGSTASNRLGSVPVRSCRPSLTYYMPSAPSLLPLLSPLPHADTISNSGETASSRRERH